MKKLFTILLAGAVFAACSTVSDAVIVGTVTGLADGTTVFLSDIRGAKVDSAIVENGKFRFEITDVHPDIMNLKFGSAPGAFPFIVEQGTIAVEVNYESTPPAVVFSGSPSNDRITIFTEGASNFDERRRALVPSIMAAQGTPAYDSLFAVYEGIGAERRAYTGEIIRDDPSTVFAAYLAFSDAIRSTDHLIIDSILTVIADAPANAFTDRLRERRDALAPTAIGVEAPDFTQIQPDGTPFSLSSLHGKLVLIDFWASWCGPCRAENPNVVKVYNAYKDKGFEILGVSLDTDREAWLKAIGEDKLTWKHVSDLGGWSNTVAKQYAVTLIPHTVLVGADGVIIAKNLRGGALEAKLAEILGAN